MRKLAPPRACLACDVGGTRIKLGIVSRGRVLSRCELAALPHRGLGSALRRIARAAPLLCSEAGLRVFQLQGCGFAFPGIIEPRSHRILSTPSGKFDDAKSTDVPRIVRKLLGLETLVCNDANAALAGEWRWGAAKGYRSAIMMTLGTGIGCSAIIDGIPLRGEHGQAGCLGGHLLANVDGKVCLCGNVGCAESEASTWALPGQARADARFPRSRLAREKPLDYALVFQAAAKDDVLAKELRARAVRVWAAALVSMVHAYDPEVAVIGGGILRAKEVILPGIRRYVARHAWTPWGKVKVLSARLGNDAGMIGVAALLEAS